MGKGSSPPPAPDYVGAAQQTAAGNLENLKYQTQANRPNVYTPWGSQTWTQNGNDWTQNISLSPEQQAALNSQLSVQQNQSQLAQQLQGQVNSTMAGGFHGPDYNSYLSGLPGVQTGFGNFNASGTGNVNLNAPQFSDAHRQQAIDAAYKASTGLLQDQWGQDNKHLDEQLRLQGLTPGSEAYNNAVQNQQRTQGQIQAQLANQAVLTGDNVANTDYASALAGYGAGNSAQGQAYGQALAGYGANQQALQNSNAAQQQAWQQAHGNFSTAYQSALQNYLQPLNSMNAVLTGQQVQSPTFPGFASAGYTPGPDILGATGALGSWNQGIWNAQQAQNGQMLGTLGQLGAAAIMASDVRLKTNIQRVGITEGGHNWYSWDWIDGSGSSRGVLAQEVALRVPSAVMRAANDCLYVDYAQLT